MEDFHLNVQENKLTDGSKVYDVNVYVANEHSPAVTFNCGSYQEARLFSNTLCDAIRHFTPAVVRQGETVGL